MSHVSTGIRGCTRGVQLAALEDGPSSLDSEYFLAACSAEPALSDEQAEPERGEAGDSSSSKDSPERGEPSGDGESEPSEPSKPSDRPTCRPKFSSGLSVAWLIGSGLCFSARSAPLVSATYPMLNAE